MIMQDGSIILCEKSGDSDAAGSHIEVIEILSPPSHTNGMHTKTRTHTHTQTLSETCAGRSDWVPNRARSMCQCITANSVASIVRCLYCIDAEASDVPAPASGKMVEIEQRPTASRMPAEAKPTPAKPSHSHKSTKKRPLHMLPKQDLQRFACPRCGKDYSQRKNMRRHLRLECGQEPKYPCPICNLRFKRHNQMSGHLMARHGIKDNSVDSKASIPIDVDEL